MLCMPFDRVRQRLYDIRDNILHARRFVGSRTAEEFAQDLRSFYAAVRALEIISEALRHLPPELKARHPEVDWVAVRDSGNVYRHGYEVVTEERIWDTIIKRLMALETAVEAELNTLGA
jgi:uncharacterized protein with HEPN domain